MLDWLALVLWLLIGFTPAITGVFIGPDRWYRSIAKPAWCPPTWVFGPLSLVLYLLIGISAWLVWMEGGLSAHPFAFFLFFLQLGLHASWPPLFFGWRRLHLACLAAAALVVSVGFNCLLFWQISPTAGLLMIPYALWVCAIFVLNSTICRQHTSHRLA